MRFLGIETMALLVLSSAALGEGRVIITEIMYNPASDERRGEAEWVELANIGQEVIQIKDWKLDDEDRAGWGPFSITLKPGGVAVLVNEAAVDEEQFRKAWDERAGAEGESEVEAEEEPEEESIYQIVPVKWASLANSPSAENEILRLLDGQGNVICEVNFQEGGDWPVCGRPDGASIWLTDPAATDLNDGKLWKRSVKGEHGARACRPTRVFDAEDVGSPGFVPRSDESAGQPAAPPTEDEGDEDQTKKDDDRIDY
jgi:hypothetical protein